MVPSSDQDMPPMPPRWAGHGGTAVALGTLSWGLGTRSFGGILCYPLSPRAWTDVPARRCFSRELSYFIFYFIFNFFLFFWAGGSLGFAQNPEFQPLEFFVFHSVQTSHPSGFDGKHLPKPLNPLPALATLGKY